MCWTVLQTQAAGSTANSAGQPHGVLHNRHNKVFRLGEPLRATPGVEPSTHTWLLPCAGHVLMHRGHLRHLAGPRPALDGGAGPCSRANPMLTSADFADMTVAASLSSGGAGAAARDVLCQRGSARQNWDPQVAALYRSDICYVQHDCT